MLERLSASVLCALAFCACADPASSPPAASGAEPAHVSPSTVERPAPGTHPPPLVLPKLEATAEDPGWTAVRAYTDLFYRGDLGQLHGKFSPEMKNSLSLDQLKALRRKVEEKYGKETRVLGTDFQAKQGYRGYARWVRFEKTDEVLEIQWILRQDDAVAGYFIRPAKSLPQDPAR